MSVVELGKKIEGSDLEMGRVTRRVKQLEEENDDQSRTIQELKEEVANLKNIAKEILPQSALAQMFQRLWMGIREAVAMPTVEQVQAVVREEVEGAFNLLPDSVWGHAQIGQGKADQRVAPPKTSPRVERGTETVPETRPQAIQVEEGKKAEERGVGGKGVGARPYGLEPEKKVSTQPYELDPPGYVATERGVGQGVFMGGLDSLASMFWAGSKIPPETIQRKAQVSVIRDGGIMELAKFPLVNHIWQTVVQPRFTGRAEDYQTFMWDFEAYIRKVAGFQEITDALTLNLFEGCLPQCLRDDLANLRRGNGNVYTFMQFKAQMDKRFGADSMGAARRKWESVELPKSGKITHLEFLKFKTEFEGAQFCVRNVTDDEARRNILAKLPIGWRKWVVDEEESLCKRKPQVLLSAM